MLMGDFNYPAINWELSQCTSIASPDCRLFLDCVEDNHLTQHVRCSTRLSAVLDLVFTDEEDMIDMIHDMGPFSSSDHNLLQWHIVTGVKEAAEVVGNKYVADYQRADFDSYRSQLRNIDWSELLDPLSTAEAWHTFKNTIADYEKQYIPRKKPRQRQKPIWLTHRAMKSVNRKYKTFSKYKSADHPAYVKAAKNAKAELRRARRNFEKKLAQQVKSDKKSFFAYVRSKTRSKITPGPLITDSGQLLTDPQDMSREFNNYFASVFTAEDTTHLPQNMNSTSPTLQTIDITEEKVRKCLAQLRSDKAPGTDDISPRLLIEISEEVVVPLTIIFKKSFGSGQVPEDWRTANVCPIYKKGHRNSAQNYRPVSLTSQICKMFERIIRDEVVNHLESNCLIKDDQHGFCTGRSCLTNLLVFLDHVSNFLDNGHCVDTIYLDFAKAFDKVPHQRLLQKICSHGISGQLLTWISSWLNGRRQRVQISGNKSGWLDVASGIPQGSVLGPLLFLMFINDLGADVTESTVILKFADDTKVLGICDNDLDHGVIQSDLHKLQQWADAWQMSFNVDKCKILHMGHGNMEYCYWLNGQELHHADTEKDLGILISNDLKVGLQCTEAYKKANKMLGLIRRTIVNKEPRILLALYKSLVRPHLEYCCSAWSPHYVKDKELLEKIQHRFTRMFKELKVLPYMDRIDRLGLWTLEERRNRADLIEVFKICNGYTTLSLEAFFEVDSYGRTRGHNWKLRKPHCTKGIRKYFFSSRVIDRWNKLTDDIVRSPSINSFKKKLRKVRDTRMGFFMD